MNNGNQTDETTDIFFQLAERQHQKWQTPILTLPDFPNATEWFNALYFLETFVRHVYIGGVSDRGYPEELSINSLGRSTDNSNDAFYISNYKSTHTYRDSIEICLSYLPTFEQLGVSIFAQAFIDVCKRERAYTPKSGSSASLLDIPLLFRQSTTDMRTQIKIGEILESLRARIKCADFINEILTQEGNFKKNYQELAAGIETCFHHSSELFVIRADLGYPEGRDQVSTLTTAKLRRDLGKFLQLLKDSVWTADVAGYIAQVEYNNSIHVVIFADALKQTEKHAYWQKVVSDLWKHATAQEGIVQFVSEPNHNGWLTISQCTGTQPINRVINYFAKSSYYLSISSKSLKHKLFCWFRPKTQPFDYAQLLMELVKKKEDIEDLARLELLNQEISLHRQPDVIQQALNQCLYSKDNLSALFYLERFFIALKYDQRDFFEIYSNTHLQSFPQINPVGRYLKQLGDQLQVVTLLNKLAVEQNLQLSPQFEFFLAGVDKHLAKATMLQFEERNNFLRELRASLDGKAFKKTSNITRSNRTAAFNSVTNYLKAVFSAYKDLHILALNLYPFGVPFPELNNGKDPGAVPLDLSESTQDNNSNSSNGTFIDEKDETEAPFKAVNKLFTLFIKKAKQPNTVKGLVGYVGKWEVDSQQRLYAHVIFLFQSSSLSTESRGLLANQLVTLWSVLSSTTGGFVQSAHIFAENEAPQSLSIPHKDFKQRRIFQTHVATYLTLSDIYIKSMFLAKHATLLKGDSPNPKPRKQQQIKSKGVKAEGSLKQNGEHMPSPSDNSPSLTDPQAMDPDL